MKNKLCQCVKKKDEKNKNKRQEKKKNKPETTKNTPFITFFITSLSLENEHGH